LPHVIDLSILSIIIKHNSFLGWGIGTQHSLVSCGQTQTWLVSKPIDAREKESTPTNAKVWLVGPLLLQLIDHPYRKTPVFKDLLKSHQIGVGPPQWGDHFAVRAQFPA